MKGVAMPPKARITKEMILNTVLEITQKSGFETVNARNIANKLQCSTRPIFTCYENMEELKRIFLTSHLNTTINMLTTTVKLQQRIPLYIYRFLI